ncbi:inositol monophosphatase/fructose-1,6-bisphosphatase family protein [Belliella baltica DSM 15883]|uniref:Inositol-1-monophosphatase n=1 Tax=Belliella baltica (strain DSM 15883 / CIP 108006 / LMG 21964 / BA134) TaxID=866536 RepID=I3Z3J8_BELBD|nr:inositol monophosphatase/fructose-1,6-bisphosphatase family protein [Belliella baltica DSM 15883]
MIDLNQILDQTKSIAKEAGAFIRKERQHFDLKKVEEKGFNDLVSYVDKEAEKIIVNKLSKVLPEAGFITEEGTREEENKTYTWIIDPLDGTTNFIHGIPVFCVSIGLMKDNEIVLGVVYEVNLHECFYALKGHGAFCNDTPIRVSAAPSLSQSLIATGFPYSAFAQIDEYLEIMKVLMQKSHGLRRLGSAAADLCYVACGRMDAYFEYNLNSYDVAAGSLIVQEAGGEVTDFKKGNDFLFGREIIAGNKPVHEGLWKELDQIWNK